MSDRVRGAPAILVKGVERADEDGRIRALTGMDMTVRDGRVGVDHRAIGLWEVDPATSHRRARPCRRRPHPRARQRPRPARGRRDVPASHDGAGLPAPQPTPVALSSRERGGTDVRNRPASARAAASVRWHCWSRSAFPTAPANRPAEAPAASVSESPSRARWPTIRGCCSPTSRPAASTPAPGRGSSS